jgi:hypothetical protein
MLVISFADSESDAFLTPRSEILDPELVQIFFTCSKKSFVIFVATKKIGYKIFPPLLLLLLDLG